MQPESRSLTAACAASHAATFAPTHERAATLMPTHECADVSRACGHMRRRSLSLSGTDALCSLAGMHAQTRTVTHARGRNVLRTRPSWLSKSNALCCCRPAAAHAASNGLKCLSSVLTHASSLTESIALSLTQPTTGSARSLIRTLLRVCGRNAVARAASHANALAANMRRRTHTVLLARGHMRRRYQRRTCGSLRGRPPAARC